MNTQNLVTYCEQLKLMVFYKELAQQLKMGKLSTEDSIEQSLLTQVNFNHDVKIQRLLKQAKLREPKADIGELTFKYWSKLNKAEVSRHFDCQWIKQRLNITAIGPTGSGKTYIACALAKQAIFQGIPVLFLRFIDLVLQLSAAEKNETLYAFRRKLSRYPLIVVDDWAIKALSDSQRHLLFEFIEERDEKASLLITSQYEVDEWHRAFGEQIMADSVLDRISNHSHFFNMSCDISLREVFGLNFKGGSHVKP